MHSILEIATMLGRSETQIWRYIKSFGMKPDQPPARRIGRPGLYDFEEFKRRYNGDIYKRLRKHA